MIDNFVPQPYPLECSAVPDSPTKVPTWHLVIGWKRDTGAGALVPLIDSEDGLAPLADQVLRYRPAMATLPRPAPAPAATELPPPPAAELS